MMAARSIETAKRKVAMLALWSIPVAVGVLALKFAAWWITDSVALYSDALESIVNVIASFFALWAIRISHMPADENHPFGHHKAEYLSAVVEGALIIVAALLIFREAFFALQSPMPLERPWPGLAINAVAGVLNAVWAWVLIRAGRPGANSSGPGRRHGLLHQDPARELDRPLPRRHVLSASDAAAAARPGVAAGAARDLECRVAEYVFGAFARRHELTAVVGVDQFAGERRDEEFTFAERVRGAVRRDAIGGQECHLADGATGAETEDGAAKIRCAACGRARDLLQNAGQLEVLVRRRVGGGAHRGGHQDSSGGKTQDRLEHEVLQKIVELQF